MATDIIKQVPNATATSLPSGDWLIAALFVIPIIVLLGWLIMKKRKELEEERDRFLLQTNMIRQEALKNADTRYYRAWWLFHKNAQVRRIYEDTVTKKIIEKPILGSQSHYMGHFPDTNGKIVFSVAVMRHFIAVPVVEVIEVPEQFVDFQEDCILIRCIGVERKSNSAPYWPVIMSKDGSITDYGFTMHDEFFRQRVATDVIEEQGNLFKNAMSKVVQINPKVKIGQHSRRIDKGV